MIVLRLARSDHCKIHLSHVANSHISQATAAWHTWPTKAILFKISRAVFTALSILNKMWNDRHLPPGCVPRCARGIEEGHALASRSQGTKTTRRAEACVAMTSGTPIGKIMMPTPSKCPISCMMSMSVVAIYNGMQTWHRLPNQVRIVANRTHSSHETCQLRFGGHVPTTA